MWHVSSADKIAFLMLWVDVWTCPLAAAAGLACVPSLCQFYAGPTCLLRQPLLFLQAASKLNPLDAACFNAFSTSSK